MLEELGLSEVLRFKETNISILRSRRTEKGNFADRYGNVLAPGFINAKNY